jgi:hypothetical protein
MRALIALFAAASLVFTGCAVQSEGADQDETESAADALTKKQIVGTWEMKTGGTIYEITFTEEYAETLGGFLKGRKFTATIDNGVRCITTPCPSTDEVTGVYKVSNSGKTVTLASYDKPSLSFSKILGAYASNLSSKGVLTLDAKDSELATHTFTKKAGVKCGTNTCGTGTYCCNPVMSICAKIGMMCIL